MSNIDIAAIRADATMPFKDEVQLVRLVGKIVPLLDALEQARMELAKEEAFANDLTSERDQLRAERDAWDSIARERHAALDTALGERDAAVRERGELRGRLATCKEAHAALIRNYSDVMDEKNALVLEVKEWRTTKGDAGK